MMNSLSGTQIGQYILKHPIGKGGMATVYRARQLNIDRDVAIKVISPDLATDAEFVARFEREAQIIAKLQHPHILPVYDFGKHDNLMYLVMRLMEGGSLAHELRQGPVPVERVLELTKQVASALDYAHRRGIVHRDLKPTNVLLDDLGNAYLTDFAIAKMISGGSATGLTQTGAVMGTPTYMAPEQWRAEPVDGRTEVYALGIIVYQMLLGQVPFAAETPHGLMYQHLDTEPPAPHTLKPDLPVTIEPVIAKALAKNRDERYAAATEFSADLEKALHIPGRLPEQTQFEVPAAPVRTEPAPAAVPQRPVQTPPPIQSAPPLYHMPPAPNNYAPPPQPLYHAEPRPYTPSPGAVRYELDYGRGRSTLSRWLLFGAAGVVVLIILGAVGLLALDLLSSDDNEAGATPTEEAGPVDVPTSPPTPTVDPSLQPSVVVQSPADNTAVELGDEVTISFAAHGALGVTRVELRRLDFTLSSLTFSGQVDVQGTFTYTPDTSGAHVLQLVAWSNDIRGPTATITINAQ